MKRRRVCLALLSIWLIIVSGCTSPGPQGSSAASDKIFVVQTPPPNMLNQLKSKEIDGFIAWEPFNAAAVEDGSGKYLIQSGQVWPAHPCCVLASSSSFSDEGVIRALVWANVKAIQFINDPANKSKVEAYAEEFTGNSPQIVQEGLKNIKFVEYPNSQEFSQFYNYMLNDKLLTKKSSDLGFANNTAFFSDFLDQSVYQTVKTNLVQNPGWQPPAIPAAVSVRLGHLDRDLHELSTYVAEKEGYYQAVGLLPGKNLIQKVFANGVAVMEAFKNREIDLAYLGGAPATLKRVNDNIQIKIVGGANDEGSAIVIRKDLSVSAIKDLAGKTIAVPTVGSIQYVILERAANQAGLHVSMK